MIVILIKSVYLLSVELQALFWKWPSGHHVTVLLTHIMNILFWGTIKRPESIASGFATSYDTCGLPAAEYNLTRSIFVFL